jgi:hypothetical protein
VNLEALSRLGDLARNDVPLLHVFGSIDPTSDHLPGGGHDSLDNAMRITATVSASSGGTLYLGCLRLFLISSTAGVLVLSSRCLAAEDASPMQPANSARPVFDKNSPYYFDGTISRPTLENYLNRSVTMGYFLVPGNPEGYAFSYKDDDIRLIRNIGAKFIGRSIYRWGEESRLNDPAFFNYAKQMVDTVHALDPEVVFQGCLFERVS